MVALGDGSVGVSRWLYGRAEIKGKKPEREGGVLGIKRVWNPLAHSTSVRWRDSSRNEWLCAHDAPGRRDHGLSQDRCPGFQGRAEAAQAPKPKEDGEQWKVGDISWQLVWTDDRDEPPPWQLAVCQTSDSDKVPGRQRDAAERLKIVLCPPDNIETQCQKLLRVAYSVSSTPELWTKICTHRLN